jgi:hypothetical protein
MKNKVIDITTFTGRDLKSRIAVREFRDLILSHNADLIIIDFKNVNFATRSFIDEFYNIIINNSEIHIELLNISSEIQAMFNAVKSTQHNVKSFQLNRNSNKVIKFSSVSEVNNYLSSLSFL